MAKELAGLDKVKLKAYWAYNVKLTSIILGIWFVVTYVCAFFSPELNSIVISGSPWATTWARRVRSSSS